MKKLLILTCVFYCATLQAQFNQDAPWMIELSNQRKSNLEPVTFQETVNAFNSYWETRDPNVKGSGYKPFKRWEYIWENEVDENGYLPTAKDKWVAWKNLNALRNDKSKVDLSDWNPIGPFSHSVTGSWSPGQARINVILVDPNNSSTWYVGTPAGGMWKSADSGVTWAPMTDNLPQIGVSGIAIEYGNSNTIYIATGDDDAGDTSSAGVFKSTDGGLTWNETGLNPSNTPSSMNDIYINPSDNNMIWVATNQGLFKSLDGGANWTNVLEGNIKDIKLKPNDPSTIYAVTLSEFYKSEDSGDTFTNITEGLPAISGRLVMDVTPANPNYVYVLSIKNINDFAYQGVFRSDNSGDSFTTRNNRGPMRDCRQGWFDLAFCASTTNAEDVYLGCLNVWRSENGGTDFRRINEWDRPTRPSYTHADIHMIRSFNDAVFVCSDGGIYRSTDGGASFKDHTRGIQASQFYSIAVAPNNANKMVGGLQDNGGHAYNNGNGNWLNYYGADGMDTAIDPTNDNKYYGFIQNGSHLHKSTNSGSSNAGSVFRPGSTGNWVTPLAINSQGKLYAGYQSLYRLNDAENDWIKLADLGDMADLVEIAPSDDSVMYISVDGFLKKTTNSGVSVTDVQEFGDNIKGIAIHSTNPNVIWVTTSNAVFKSVDGGNTFSNITGNLPTSDRYMFLNDIVHEPNNSQNPIYVASSLGVFRTVDGGSWELFSNKLPTTIVTDLEINIVDQSITAATYGRGIWRSSLPTCNTLTADQELAIDGGDFEPAMTTAGLCTGQSVSFRPTVTTGSNPSYSWVGPNGFTSSDQLVTISNLTLANAGTYSVTINAGGTCGAVNFEFNIDLEDTTEPIADSVTICNDSTADLLATGSVDYKWFDAPTGGTVLGTGNTYTTPSLTQNTTFYVSGTSSRIVSEKTLSPGIETAQNYDTPQGLVFSTTDAIVLESFTMSAVTAGDRIIQVIDKNGIEIAKKTVNIPAGESLVTVNFEIPKGEDYTIRIPSGLVNMRRTPSGTGVVYPYTSPSNIVSITKNTVVTIDFYYFFYDWNFTSAGGRCESVRTPVNVTVNPDNPDLSDGDTTYTINSGSVNSFTAGETILIDENSNLELNLPESSFSGTLLWTAPDGTTFSTNTVSLEDVVSGGPFEGDWNVKITFMPSCGSSSEQTINFSLAIGTLSTNENEFKNLKIYPNPTSNKITITSANDLEDLNLSVVDIRGRVLKFDFDPETISSNKLIMDLSELETGMYFLILEDNQYKSIKSIIKN